jgi:deoxyribose-phosphate aldolase
MISPTSVIAASLSLEPDRAAVCRDVHRANARGISVLVVNENMVVCAMEEVRNAGLSVQITGLIGFPIGQWIWSAKKVAVDELAGIQNGPVAVMHGVGPWLDGAASSLEEFAGLGQITGDRWIVTSLSSIPEARLSALADDIAQTGASHLILSNGVAASGLPLPDARLIATFAKQVAGRFKLAAMMPAGTDTTTINATLDAGADKVVCADFWTLTDHT